MYFTIYAFFRFRPSLLLFPHLMRARPVESILRRFVGAAGNELGEGYESGSGKIKFHHLHLKDAN